MRRLGLISALTAVVLLLAGTASAASAATVIAHRGTAAAAPENTLAGLSAAVRAGADVVEVDVRVTADGRLVLLHDATLRRTTDVERRYPARSPWRVADFTLAELGRLDAGGWKGPEHAGERIPTLAQALEAVRGRAGVLIELKDPRRELRMEALVAEHLTVDGTATGAPDPGHEATVQSFDYLAIARFAALQPTIPTAVLTRTAPSPAQLSIFSHFADQVAPPHPAVDRGLVRAARSHGLGVSPYTVNRAARMRRLLRLGVDGMVTDVPGRLHRIRQARAL